METIEKDKERVRSIALGNLTKEELVDTLHLFVRSIRRVRLCGNKEVVDSITYYERNIRNSGIWLSVTSFRSPVFEDGVRYYASIFSDTDSSVRQQVTFDCNNSSAVVCSYSEDVGMLINICKFLEVDFEYILWRIEHCKE